MSEKEYKIEVSGDRVTVKEVEKTYADPGVLNFEPTFRERVGYKMRSMSKGAKIFWTLCFNIYGYLHRWGSNSGIAYVFSFVLLIFQSTAACSILPEILRNLNQGGNDTLDMLKGFCFCFAFLPIDLISIIATGDIALFGHIKYPDCKR